MKPNHGYQKTVLENGLRILTTPMPHTRSVGIGLFAGVGSRYETAAQKGISHFIEHVMFKGTQRRPKAQQISEAIEGLGGILNASTDNEVTTYWAKVAHHHLPVALDVLLDMFRHSTFEPEEIEKERQVIIQEINGLMDMPESWVHVLAADLIWPNHPVGWDIAGTKESVSGLTRNDILHYIAYGYTPGNTVVSLAGNFGLTDALGQLSQELSSWSSQPAPTYLPADDAPPGPRLLLEYRKTEQAHLCVGMRGLSHSDPDRFKLLLLNTILGEGMSCRLFVDVREKQGLAYSVGSYTSQLRDTGAIVLHAGVPPNKAAAVVGAMMNQLRLLCDEPVPPEELNKAKEFTKGRILLRMEDTFANATWVGHQEVTDQQVLSVDDIVMRVDEVTVEDIQQVAQRLFSTEKLTLATIGPFKKESEFLQRLEL